MSRYVASGVLVSYVLYGDAVRYKKGLLASIPKLAAKDWAVGVLVEESVSNDIVLEIQALGAIVVSFKSKSSAHGMIERLYLHNHFKNIDCMFVRDADSIISDEELSYMEWFVRSDFLIHTIRSHQSHDMPLMGGLSGYRRDVLDYLDSYMVRRLFSYVKNLAVYASDQKYMTLLYVKFFKHVYVHTAGNYFSGEMTSTIAVDQATYPGRSIIQKELALDVRPKNIMRRKLQIRLLLWRILITMRVL
jgi:hypothetical protein